MARPHRPRQVACLPRTNLFKPVGVPARDLENLVLKIDELEAMRLVDLEGLSHEKAAQNLGVSRQTVGRLLEQGRRVVTEALLKARSLAIEGGSFRLAPAPPCRACGQSHFLAPGELPGTCPTCTGLSLGGGRGCGHGEGRGRRRAGRGWSERHGRSRGADPLAGGRGAEDGVDE
ncbi:MAG: DUF134 domain-containing protein [Candidatus Xenobium sp.]|nr:DUF134 domain-containing protein [Burkholderiales bacterium]